ncbi:TPA: DUF551 domain-containing protein [Escherichia coli]|nr:DUF551 domain-containing protein [Escherichia coli]
MSAITKERIELFIKNPLENGLTRGEQMELARIALASLEAEPVAYIIQDSDARSRGEKGILRYFANISDEDINEYEITVTPLYAAPPETVSVPDAMEMDDDFDSAFEHGKVVGWNAYRAAMFQSGNFRENKNSSTNNFREIAETSTNYPVIPSEVLSAIQKVAKIRADFDDFDGDRRGIGDCLDEAEQELIVTINKYASQLAVEPVVPAVLERLRSIVADPRALPRRKEWVSGQQYSYVLLENVEAMVDEACRAAMLHGAEPVSQTYKSQHTQFEQVADLYEMQFDDGRTCAFHTDAQKAAQWLQACDENRVQEYVKLERLRNALSGNYPVTPDGWISCSERMPEKNQNVLISVNFDSDLVEPLICSARYTGSTFRRGGVTVMPGNGIEQATHWMPLPEPPQEVNRG